MQSRSIPDEKRCIAALHFTVTAQSLGLSVPCAPPDCMPQAVRLQVIYRSFGDKQKKVD